MKRQRLTTAAALLAACALAFTACARNEPGEPGEKGPDEKTADYYTPGVYDKETPGEPTDGGTLTLADYAETRSLDPSKTVATGYSGGTSLVAVYDQLVRWNVREQEFEPRLAESVEPNDDYTEWTIKLRKDVKFSDGTPVNADAVIGSFNYYIENKGYDLAVVGPLWAGAEKVDDETVKVKLRAAWATFPFALGMGMGFIVAPAAIEGGPDNFKPIGAGAFTFESYKPQEELVLAANPEYWDGKPHLEKLRMVWLGADETKNESLQSNAVQAMVVRDIRIVKQIREADGSGWVSLDNMGNMINVNHAEGRPGANPKVAKAIAHAIDEQALYDRIYDGEGLPTKHIFGKESRWHNADAEAPEYDIEQAKKLLEEAKSEGFDGKVVLTSSADPISRDQAMVLKAQLEAAGFTVENDLVRSIADITNKIYIERNYDFARSALSVTEADPFWRLYSSFYSTAASNSSGYADKDYDAMVDELRSTDMDDREEIVKKIEQKFLEDLPAISLANNANMVAWSNNVFGVQPTNDAMLGFEKAWIAN
ncbi:ABC transporter substrate-binding protein [Enemella sp. A6]|uniref:ABC transporter substrate-binding protein n=1 Tax=Enemella sp. A6 TaxID=3440152 RepID=UPI003EBB86CB